MKPNEYFENNIAFNVFSLKNDLNKLDKPVNKTKWGKNVTSELFCVKILGGMKLVVNYETVSKFLVKMQRCHLLNL